MAARSFSKLGKALFGSLTASTVGLGIWQTMRFLEEKPEPQKRVIKASDLVLNRPVLVGPRKGGAANKPGYYVYIPSPSENVLVCLGWTQDKAPDLSSIKFSKETFDIFTRHGEKGNRFSPANPPNGPFLWMDEDQMLRVAGLEAPAAKLAEVYDVVAPGVLAPKERPEPYLTKWTHAGYAATWYSLSVAGVFMMRKMFK